MRPSFILHIDSLSIINKLSDQQVSDLTRTIFFYQVNGSLPKNIDPLIDIIITPFINQFKRDEEKYLKTVDRNKQNGSKGGRPKNPVESGKPSGLSGLTEKPKKADSDNKSVNDSDSDSDSDNKSVNDNVNEIINYFNTKTGRNYKGDKVLISDIKKVLSNFTFADCKKVIDYISTNKWHIENNQIHLASIFRPTKFAEKLEKAIYVVPNIKDKLHRCNDQDFNNTDF